MTNRSLLSWVEISRAAFARNVTGLKRLAGDRHLAVCVKANAYGHGLAEIVGLAAAQADISYLTVHSIEEATEARWAGWRRAIMVLGPIAPQALPEVVPLQLEPVVFDRVTLAALGRLARRHRARIKTHLKLETGTNRQGVTSDELPALAAVYRKYPELGGPWGASTHFANIEDTTVHEYAEYQLANFRQLVRQMHRLGLRPKLQHTASSAALILFEKTRFDLVRPGLSVYGHWPSKETYLSYLMQGGRNDLFRPVLSWRSRVTQIKKLPADSFVGYGCTYRTTAPTKLAVVPIGYADGYDRDLSNQAHVLIRGRRAPVRGRVCMNLIMVDVTDIKGARQGDVVTLIGADGQEILTAEQLAQWAGTINYEILSRLNPLLPRVVVT